MRQRSEGFFTFIVLLAVLSLLFRSINNFPSQEPDPDFSEGGGSGTENDGGDTGDPGEDGDNSDNITCDHIDGDNDGICDECGNQYSGGGDTGDPDIPSDPGGSDCEHVDTDDDGNCDKCGVEFSDGEDTPTDPDVPECEHADTDDDNLCDKCGEEFSDGEETPDTPEDPEECQHSDANDDGKCDKCEEPFTDGDDSPNEDYTNSPGSSGDNRKNAEYVDTIERVDGQESYDIERLEVDLDVLYANRVFYGANCYVEMEEYLNIIPITVDSEGAYLYRVRITFIDLAAFNNCASRIQSDNYSKIVLNEAELCVDIYYNLNDLDDNTSVYPGERVTQITSTGNIPDSAIKSITVDTIR